VIIMGVQFIKTPAGDEMAVLPRAEYDALIEAALEAGEDAADIAAYEAAKADKIGSAPLPFEVSQAMLKGASLLKALRLWRNETQMHLAFKTETSQGLISDLENRRRDLTGEMARRLSIALDIPRDWLG
jgi:antitoxin component HigA of HigAB toxin-antitoxin module